MKKSTIYSYAVITLFVCVTLGVIFWVNYNEPDKTIERQYRTVQLPDVVHFENKHWEPNVGERDDALFPAMSYLYSFSKDTAPIQIAQQLQQTFKTYGYAISPITETEFSAQNTKLSAHIIVGLENRNVNTSLKDAAHSVDIRVVQTH